MNRRLPLLLTVCLLLGACAPATSPPASTAAGAHTSRPSPTPIPATATTTATPLPPPPTATPTSNRTATFSEIQNTVDARTSQNVDFAPASLGQVLKSGGEARTGEDGKARLDLAPDGTIIRIAPNTIFTVPQLYGGETGPFTKIQLLFGKVWILLKGGSLEVETPSGVASVRGSLLGISYNAGTGAMTATCLEGHCSLASGDRLIELIGGQAADILDGTLPDQPRYMTLAEVIEWLNEAPELRDFIDRLPDIPGVPRDLLNRLADRDKRDNLPGRRDRSPRH